MHEMRPRIDETLQWIRAGDQDLLSAVVLLKHAEPLIAPGLFHCQQAVEKWLKAILIWHGAVFPKVHDLGRLGALCLAVEPDLQDLISTVADLTDFATVPLSRQYRREANWAPPLAVTYKKALPRDWVEIQFVRLQAGKLAGFDGPF